MQKIRQDIKTGTYAPVYLLYGPEGYLRRSAVRLLREAIAGDDEMNYTYREGREIAVPEIRDIAETMPFFADRRLIVIENSGLMKKGGDEMLQLLEQLPDTTCLVFSEEEVDKRSRLFKKAAQLGYALECKTPTGKELERFVLKGFGSLNLGITRDAMELFLERAPGELDGIRNEMEKLAAYCLGRAGVTVADVEAITSVTINDRIFDMIDAIAGGRAEQALRLYDDLVALKEPPIKILVLLTRQFNLLLQVKELQRLGGTQKSISEQTGAPFFQIKKCLYQASRFSEEALRRRLLRLIESDAEIKNGNLKDSLAVELLIAEFCHSKN